MARDSLQNIDKRHRRDKSEQEYVPNVPSQETQHTAIKKLHCDPSVIVLILIFLQTMTYLLPEQPDKEEPVLEKKEASFDRRQRVVDLAVERMGVKQQLSIV